MIRDIVVHLNGSPQDEERLAYAIQVAETFDAHLTGLAENTLIELPVAFGSLEMTADLTDKVVAEAEARASRLVDRLQQKLSTTALRNGVERVDAFPGGMADAMARRARTADLFVGTLSYAKEAAGEGIAEAVLFGSGRGCFFVPRGGKPPRNYDRVLVAWKDTREAARAISEALPFIHRAKDIAVAVVEEHGAAERFGDDVAADIGRYFGRHNLKVEVRKINGWDSASDALANEARQFQADLLVMGGYGHSRFREWALGGVTRDLLGSATIPVLMAH